jgi:hypothetical protein
MPTDDDNSTAVDAEYEAMIAEYRRRGIKNEALDAIIAEVAAREAESATQL